MSDETFIKFCRLAGNDVRTIVDKLNDPMYGAASRKEPWTEAEVVEALERPGTPGHPGYKGEDQ